MAPTQRLAFWACLVAAAAVFTFGTIWYMKKPALYPGDRLESRTCRDCGGTGVMGDYMEGEPQPGMPAKDGPCVTCGGRKEVKVIIPGPNHPSWVKGTVVDEAKVPVRTGYAEVDDALAVQEMMANRNPMEPVPGAIPNALVVFERGSQKVEVHSANTGRLRAQLPPGTWKVTATADGFARYSGELVVPPLTFPLYQEEAHVVRAPEDMGQEQAEHGLPMQIRMKKG